ncbi:MAG TPA: alpha/beta fold hydrolase [Gemmatimonadaceae bacterium]
MESVRRAAPENDPRVAIRGEGPPLVLVPGLDGTGLLFYRQVPLLARRHRVVTYALREDAPSMDALVEQLRRVVDLAAPDGARATIVGESFGGALALSFALAHPGRVAAVVVLNSFPRFLPQLRLHLAIAGIRIVPWAAMALVRRLTAFRLHSPHTHRAEIRTFLELTRRTTRRGYLSRLSILREYDVRERLAELRVPSLFLASDRDHLVPSVREATRMASRAPGARLRVLAGHGHVCLIAPDVDLDEILADWEAERRRPVPDAPASPAGSAGPCTSGI